MINLSIILPTAHRPTMLQNFLSSVQSTVKHMSSIEVIAGVEPDDEDTKKVLRSCKFFVKGFVAEMKGNLAKYQNLLAEHATGNYLWLLNDDAEILTYGFDAEIAKLSMWNYGHVDSKSPGRYAEFPVLGRCAVEALGYLAPPQMTAWHTDPYLYNIYNGAGLVEHTKIEVRHTKVFDKTRASMEKNHTNQELTSAEDITRLTTIFTYAK